MTAEPAPEPAGPRAESTCTVSRGPGHFIGVSSASDIANLVPHLLGFHPDNSLVVLVLSGPRQSALQFTLRIPLREPGVRDPGGRLVADLLDAEGCRRAVAVGYGPEVQVTPLVEQFRAAAAEHGIKLRDILRIEAARVWSYVCTDPLCCPPEGTPWTLADDPELASLLPKGLSGVLDNRESLAALVGPVTGRDAEAMRRATRRAQARATRLRQQAQDVGQPAHALAVREGVEAMTAAMRAYRDGGAVPRGQLAWLTVALRDIQVRDDAWSRLGTAPVEDEIRLLLDLTRLARRGYAAAPAALLAYAAWQAGNGALANVALDRALADNPGYSLADLLAQAIRNGLDPSKLRKVLMTPEMLAQEYARRRG